MNESLYHQHQLQYHGGPQFPWPAPDTFAAYVNWPGDMPQFPRGEQVHDEEPGEEEEAADAAEEGNEREASEEEDDDDEEEDRNSE